MPKVDLSDKPYVDNYPALKAWLDSVDARCDWQAGVGPIDCGSSPSRYVEQWRLPNGKHFLILVHADRRGWDIFTPCYTNDTLVTFCDAEKRLGITS